MSYMASMINLPIFLEQACGLTPAFIGLLIFVRPGFGSMMSTFLGRVMGKPEHWLTKHRMVKIGSVVALVSYCVLAAGAQIIAAAPNFAGPIVIFTLFLQASGSFSVFLGGNALVLERVPEENLSNVSAIRNMMSQMASTMAAAVGLSVVRNQTTFSSNKFICGCRTVTQRKRMRTGAIGWLSVGSAGVLSAVGNADHIIVHHDVVGILWTR